MSEAKPYNDAEIAGFEDELREPDWTAGGLRRWGLERRRWLATLDAANARWIREIKEAEKEDAEMQERLAEKIARIRELEADRKRLKGLADLVSGAAGHIVLQLDPELMHGWMLIDSATGDVTAGIDLESAIDAAMEKGDGK